MNGGKPASKGAPCLRSAYGAANVPDSQNLRRIFVNQPSGSAPHHPHLAGQYNSEPGAQILATSGPGLEYHEEVRLGN